MSRLKVDNIEARSGNNISMDDPLALKSYTTAQRDALTSVAGDMIYNSTTSKVEHYNGSAWASGLAAIQIQYVIVGGGGSGASIYGAGNLTCSGAGAGGYISSVIGENSGGGLSSQQVMYLAPSTNYPVSIGAGGTAASSGSKQESGYIGNTSYFNNIVANGGGAAQSYVQKLAKGRQISGGSGAGRGAYINHAGVTDEGGQGLAGQGFDGGATQQKSNGAANAAGGGGGASAAGGDGSSNNGGNGGAGVATSISGSSVTYAGGGGGGAYSTQGTGGAGGGADGVKNATGNAGTINTGGGAGGLYRTNTSQSYGGNGGSGIIILRYPNTYTLSHTGLTTSNINTAVGDDKYTTITGGTGTVSFS